MFNVTAGVGDKFGDDPNYPGTYRAFNQLDFWGRVSTYASLSPDWQLEGGISGLWGPKTGGADQPSGTATEQGVLQPGPREVSASAPDGTESSWSCTVEGVDLKASKENEEQPARVNPAAAMAMTRRMINLPPYCGQWPQSPRRP